MYRQGDVIFVKANSVPENAVQSKRSGRYVLAEGEATGHAHAITDVQTVEHYTLPDGRQWLIAPEQGATVTHEEHGPITLPAGVWLVYQQREYVPGSWRTVYD